MTAIENHPPMVSYYICFDFIVRYHFLDVETYMEKAYMGQENIPHYTHELEKYFSKLHPQNLTVQDRDGERTTNHVVNLIKSTCFYVGNELSHKTYEIEKQKSFINGEEFLRLNVDSWEEPSETQLCGFGQGWNGNKNIKYWCYTNRRLLHETDMNSL